MIYYTWNDPAGERKIMWQNKGKGNVENDLRRDGVDEFIISRESSNEEPSTSNGIRQQSPDSDTIFWVSFLDGTQRVLLFTKNEAIAASTQSSSKLDQVRIIFNF